MQKEYNRQIILSKLCLGRSQWPHGLKHRSAAARLLRLWVRIPPGAWKFFCCECCVLSGRGLCDELITRPEEPYRLWCVVECDLETMGMTRPWPNWTVAPQTNYGCNCLSSPTIQQWNITNENPSITCSIYTCYSVVTTGVLISP